SDLSDGYSLARSGIDAVNSGDYEEAAARFGEASDVFASADDSVGAAWLRPAQLVPVVAQNQRAATELAAAAADVSADLEHAL
ncbi:hypothetical protein RCL06_24720, partial [Salmonella enterica subsp. enterica serovar Typhimurium]